MANFGERFGYTKPDAEISVREDAPESLRHIIPVVFYKIGQAPSALRDILCETFLCAPDKSNWTEFPNIAGEVEGLLDRCEWFEVYDALEHICEFLSGRRFHGGELDEFVSTMNRFFGVNGIGWQLVQGRIEMRGPEAFEIAVRQGRDALWSAGKQTAATELHEAIVDLSRRPNAEITGAIQHAMAALECVARDVCDSKATLGDLIQRNPGLFPKPLDVMVDKAWGWTSNNGRHLTEGSEPGFDEAELIVGMSGVLCRYLSRRFDRQ